MVSTQSHPAHQTPNLYACHDQLSHHEAPHPKEHALAPAYLTSRTRPHLAPALGLDSSTKYQGYLSALLALLRV